MLEVAEHPSLSDTLPALCSRKVQEKEEIGRWCKGFIARPNLLRVELQGSLVSHRRKIITIQHNDLATCQRWPNVVLYILAAVLEEPLQLRGWCDLLSAMLSQLSQLLPPWSFGGLFQAYHLIAGSLQALV